MLHLTVIKKIIIGKIYFFELKKIRNESGGRKRRINQNVKLNNSESLMFREVLSPKKKIIKEKKKVLVKEKKLKKVPAKGKTSEQKFGFISDEPNHQWRSTRLRAKANNIGDKNRWI